MSEYKKITSIQVLKYIEEHRFTIDFYEVYWSAGMIAKYLNTSVYQARKHLNKLLISGKLKYGNTVFYEYGEYNKIEYRSPPICGYTINENTYE